MTQTAMMDRQRALTCINPPLGISGHEVTNRVEWKISSLRLPVNHLMQTEIARKHDDLSPDCRTSAEPPLSTSRNRWRLSTSGVGTSSALSRAPDETFAKQE